MGCISNTYSTHVIHSKKKKLFSNRNNMQKKLFRTVFVEGCWQCGGVGWLVLVVSAVINHQTITKKTCK